MANEATKIEDSGLNPVRRTCASTAQISGGALLVLGDPNTVTATSGGSLAKVFGGVAASSKSSSDAATTIGAHMSGCWDIKLDPSSACTIGDLLEISGANMVRVISNMSSISGGKVVGRAEETGSAGEVIRVRLMNY